jgi:hypothetical protein
MTQVSPLKFFSLLRWLDGQPLLNVIEDYRQRIFTDALYTFDATGRPRYNLVLCGRAKKNWKTADLVLAALYKLLAWKSDGGNQCFILANDLDQANDDFSLAKKLIESRDPKTLWLKSLNSILNDELVIKQKVIERRDGRGFLEILPAGDIVGSHGKTFLFCAFDEIHGYRTWDILEALAHDPTRHDSVQWITSYASIYHRPGVPLFDLFARGKSGKDRRMFFSWYAGDFTTDKTCESLPPEDKANPSRKSWGDDDYVEQQRGRLPSHKFRRLHLNLGGAPEGSAYSAEKIMDSVERGVTARLPVAGVSYQAFVDMSGGSSDDACLAIAHRDADGKAILDRVLNQGQRPPFDPMVAVKRFLAVLKDYHISNVTGDAYAGETFVSAFTNLGIGYVVSQLSRSEIYESIEPHFNAGKIVLLDEPELESQFLGLIWRGGKIDHANGEPDDWSNTCAGAVHKVMDGGALNLNLMLGGGRRAVNGNRDWHNQGVSDRGIDERVPGAGTVTVRINGGGRFDW